LSAEKTTDEWAVDAAQASTAAKIPQLTHRESSGILTSMGYYTPLSRLEEYLNPASQAVYGTNAIDIIAVVSDSTRKPERAKAGPKDYFTIFRTTEPSTTPASSVRVEVFRPWKAKLPVAEVGDVILLRGFVVKSRKRKPYLLSTDASGCHPSSSVREEVTGPPVELSEAERSQVRTLRSIATGKSTVSQILSSSPYNLPIVDADKVARQVVEPGTAGYNQIVAHFGPSTPDLLVAPSPENGGEAGQNGKGRPLNRPALGRRVFGEGKDEDRKALNKIVHPAVRRE
ncbi:hypothetical protein KC336_g20786, partial [Hortaea werneckii]